VASIFNSSTSVNATSTSTWSCTSTKRNLTANGLPDHAVGTFPNANNPNAIAAQSVSASLNLTPSYSGAVRVLGGAAGGAGYILNGVKIDAATAGTCNDTGSQCDAKGNVGNWNIEAVNSGFNFGTDSNNAHVQPGGAYHYHGMPEGFVAKLGKGATMTLIGWAVDGFPIYARYGYATATNASSAIKAVTSSYRLKTSVPSNRAPTSQYKLGTFEQDYEYVSGLGDLDECNGRYGVTPEFPSGTYHYFAIDTYPFLQRCVKGNA
jgi:YHYH protein